MDEQTAIICVTKPVQLNKETPAVLITKVTVENCDKPNPLIRQALCILDQDDQYRPVNGQQNVTTKAHMSISTYKAMFAAFAPFKQSINAAYVE